MSPMLKSMYRVKTASIFIIFLVKSDVILSVHVSIEYKINKVAKVRIAEITWLSVRDEINTPTEINDAQRSIKPRYDTIVSLSEGVLIINVITGKTSETASVIKKTQSAAKYLPNTIDETFTGAVIKSCSVFLLRSSAKSCIVSTGTINKQSVLIEDNT